MWWGEGARWHAAASVSGCGLRAAVQRRASTCSVVATVASFFVLDDLDLVPRAIVRARGRAGHLVRDDMAAGVRVLVPRAHGVDV